MSALKTPEFWYRKADEAISFGEKALSPAARVYEMLYHWHQHSKKPYKASIPVVCLGNIVTGGTGKTPTAVAVMDILRGAGLAKNPYFLLRGYGGSETGPVLVDPLMHSAWEVGDEALILAKTAPTIVSANRAAGVQFAERRGADLIVMDDGLQNPGLHKDLKFVLINGEMGFGNGKMIPAGPLRQPLDEGLMNADAVIIIGPDKRSALEIIPSDKIILHAHLEQTASAKIDKSAKYLAFAGLGYPDKFFNFLRENAGLDIQHTIKFADHCPYSDYDLRMLKARSEAMGARLITTEKDFMRIPATENLQIDVMPVQMVFDDKNAIVELLKGAIARP